MAVKDVFVNGKTKTAIPNYARNNRPAPRAPGVRSEVWFKSGN